MKESSHNVVTVPLCSDAEVMTVVETEHDQVFVSRFKNNL